METNREKISNALNSANVIDAFISIDILVRWRILDFKRDKLIGAQKACELFDILRKENASSGVSEKLQRTLMVLNELDFIEYLHSSLLVQAIQHVRRNPFLHATQKQRLCTRLKSKKHSELEVAALLTQQCSY